MTRAHTLRRLSVALASVAMISAWAAPSHAALLNVYSSQSAWTTAAGTPLTTETFSGGGLASGLSATGAFVSGGVLNGEALPQVFPVAQRDALGFTPGVKAFGGDWDLSPGGPGAGLGFLLTFADASTQNYFGLTNPAGGTFSGFFGFVSDTAITSVSFFTGSLTGNGELFTLDNLSFGGGTTNGGGNNGGGTPVPEPTTFTLLASGLLGLAWRMRRRSLMTK